ncbi:MAG TPA: hypothetical protein VFQ44_04185 [Streptosporangiaceae bacterium]|nr:hypothetical protein [Streptosporangiaceae bacterium]
MTALPVIAARAARAVLAMDHPPGGPGRILVEWAAEPKARSAWQRPRIGCQAVSDLVVAHAGRGAASLLQIADVIVCSGRLAAPTAPGCLRAAFRHYPGCAVAAVELGAGGCLAGTPGQAPIRLAVGQSGAPAGSCVRACAAFVHGWLAAGQSLASLRPVSLRIPSSAAGGRECPSPDGIVTMSFGVAYEPEAPDLGASSRTCISSASGAPI